MTTHASIARILLAGAAVGLAACAQPGPADDTGTTDDTGQADTGDTDTDDAQTSTAQGQVTDQDGAQYRDLGGSGTVYAATEVTASTVADDGTLTAVGSASVDAQGAYSIEVPANERELVLEAWSSEGELVASAILESSGEAGSTVTVTPMDTESSVETEVYLQMVAQEDSAEDVNWIDLRARIDADTAVEVRLAAQEDQDEADAEIVALAEAVAAAQATEIQAWSEMGFDTSQQAMYEAELQASQALSAALDAGEDAESAYGAFFAELSAALEAQSGFDADESAEGETQSSTAFRLTLEGRSDNEGMVYEATHAAAQAEAWASARAAEAAFVAGGASAQVEFEAESTGEDLQSDVESAASLDAMITAYDEFSGDLVGESTVEGSTLGDYLEVDATGALAVDGAIDASAAAADTYAATLDTALATTLAASGDLDEDAVATTIVEAWATYRSSVEAAVDGAGDAIPSGEHEVAATVIAEATGSFRGER